jgi:lipopolysaccharide assembly protein A
LSGEHRDLNSSSLLKNLTWIYNRKMNRLTNLLISIIAAIWIALIALISVQNASVVSIKFVFWKSIDLPWGLVLAGAVALGLILGGCLPLLGKNFTFRG